MYQRRTIDRAVRKSKLEELADAWGMSADELLENAAMDSAVPGICTNNGCDYTAEYEPDQDAGWCEECNVGTVASALILAGVI
ncbi:MAG: hypothetical protein ABIS20_01245 [Thermoanaerobaculia bacterium]